MVFSSGCAGITWEASPSSGLGRGGGIFFFKAHPGDANSAVRTTGSGYMQKRISH